MNNADKNPLSRNTKEKDESQEQTLNPPLSTLHFDDDRVVFIPTEEIRAIEKIYFKMIQAKQEFIKMTEEPKKVPC